MEAITGFPIRRRGAPPIRHILSLTRNLSILAFGEVLARGLTFVAFAHLARALGPSSYGLVESAMAVMMVATLLVDQGFGTLGAREIARDPSIAEALTERVVSARLILALTVSALVAFGAWALPLSSTLSVLLTGFGLSLMGLPFLLNWVFQGRGEMFWYAAPPVLRQGTFLLVVLLLVSGPEDVTNLPLAEIAAALSIALVYLTVFRARVGPLSIRIRGGLDRDLFKEALPIGGSQLIWAVRTFVPVLFVGALIGPAGAAMFAVGHRIVMVYLAGLEVYFTNLLPQLSRISHQIAALRRLYGRTLLLILAPTVAWGVVSLWIAPAILSLVFGTQYAVRESVSSFLILTWLVPVAALRRTGRLTLIVRNLQRDEFRVSMIGLVLLLVLLAPLTLWIGVQGAAIAMLSSELVATGLTWSVLLSRLRQGEAQVSGRVGHGDRHADP